LAQLAAAGHEIALVLTQPDRPAGRGLRPLPSPVKRFAVAAGMAVFQPERLSDPADIGRVRGVGADALVVAAYGLLLPPALLEAARHGAINIHASLLPRWRGAAPIQRALLAGDSHSGISIMQMDAGLDTGPVLDRKSVAIGEGEDFGSLHERLAELGARMIVDTLAAISAGHARAVPQPAEGVTYARKIVRQDTELDWTRPAAELERAVRAFRPTPGAAARLEGKPVKIWRARPVDARLAPGEVAENLVVGCGEGALQLLELQAAGGKRLAAAEFLRGYRLRAGARFE
jgi:methionyl-tRNA formyltransferase